jgi:aerobic carbon-monoxide dehydrogenase medium subunit
MKAPAFTYHAPHTTDEALTLLTSLDNARLLAGGQSLMPMLNFRLIAYDHFIDLGRIPDLQGISETQTHILIKAMTTQREIEHSDLIRRHCPLLIAALHHVGHQQTRNRGTIGGSLCHLDPGAELPVAAAALNANLIVISPRGTRHIAFADFSADYLTNTLRDDELLYAIECAKSSARNGVAFVEFNRRPADFAIVSVAASLTINAQQHIQSLALALGGVHHAPIRLSALEHECVGHVLPHDMRALIAAKLNDIDIRGDELYPADYRRDIAITLIERALNQALASAGASL